MSNKAFIKIAADKPVTADIQIINVNFHGTPDNNMIIDGKTVIIRNSTIISGPITIKTWLDLGSDLIPRTLRKIRKWTRG